MQNSSKRQPGFTTSLIGYKAGGWETAC